MDLHVPYMRRDDTTTTCAGITRKKQSDRASVDSLDSLEFSCAPAEPFSGFGVDVPTQRMMTVGKR